MIKVCGFPDFCRGGFILPMPVIQVAGMENTLICDVEQKRNTDVGRTEGFDF